MFQSGASQAYDPDVPARTGDKAATDAIDLVYLSRQTLGDRSLELELLRLFEAQAGHVLDQIAAAGPKGDLKLRRDLAHTLKGSARAIGAVAVAASARAYEDALSDGSPVAMVARTFDALEEAVAAARRTARELVAGEAK